MAFTRRVFLALPATLAAQPAHTSAEAARYGDPATEFEVIRLTDPARSSAFLPRPYARIFDRRGRNMLYLSDRSGSLQAYTMDLRSRQSRLVSQAASMDPSTPSLTPDDRAVCFIDGNEVVLASMSGAGRGRTLYRLSQPSPGTGLSVTPDGPSALVVEAGTRLRRIPLARGVAATAAENPAGVRDPMPRPRRASVAYRDNDGGLWLAHLDGSRNTQLKPQPGVLGPALWSPDGKTILYLHLTPKANTIRQIDPDTGEDQAVGSTSGYVGFSPNGDASVFVGASGSKASPYVLVMVRLVRRELALCEHKASDPTSVRPVFTPDSQRIVFQSDRHGKPALYTMTVDKLIEKTESAEEEPSR
jgi:oligogalacturonide lyase